MNRFFPALLLTLIMLQVSAADAQFSATGKATAEQQSGSIAFTTKPSNEAGETLLHSAERLAPLRLQRSGLRGRTNHWSLGASDTRQNKTFLNGIRLDSPDGGAFDLALLPNSAIASLELYPFAPPLSFGPAPIGGALLLRTSKQAQLRTTLSAGTLGYFSLDGLAVLPFEDGELLFSADIVNSNENALFTDDRGTPFDDSDDQQRERENSDFLRSRVLSALSYQLSEDWTLRGLVSRGQQVGGESGPASALALHTSRQRSASLLAIAADYSPRANSNISLSLAWQHIRDTLSDPYFELLRTRSRKTEGDSVQARLAGTYSLLKNLRLSAGLNAGMSLWDYSDSDSHLAPERLSVDGTIELRYLFKLFGNAMLYARAQLSHQRIGERHSDEADSASFPTGVGGARWSPLKELRVDLNFAHGARTPTIVERFGNSSTLLANPRLQEESSNSIRLGALYQKDTDSYSLKAQAQAYSSWISDLIRYRINAQGFAIAENEESVTSLGLDLSSSLRIPNILFINALWSFVAAETSTERKLPLRPSHRARAEIGTTVRLLPFFDSVSMSAAANFRSSYFSDPANLIELDHRFWLDAGLKANIDENWQLALRIEDIFDTRGMDILGFPLAGRRFFVHVRHRLPL